VLGQNPASNQEAQLQLMRSRGQPENPCSAVNIEEVNLNNKNYY